MASAPLDRALATFAGPARAAHPVLWELLSQRVPISMLPNGTISAAVGAGIVWQAKRRRVHQLGSLLVSYLFRCIFYISRRDEISPVLHPTYISLSVALCSYYQHVCSTLPILAPVCLRALLRKVCDASAMVGAAETEPLGEYAPGPGVLSDVFLSAGTRSLKVYRGEAFSLLVGVVEG